MNKHIHQNYFFSTICLMLGIVLFVGVVSFFHVNNAQGYGYGYGYGASCSADAPEQLTVQVKKAIRVKNKHNHTKQKLPRGLLFSWDEVAFAYCDDETPDHYRLDILDAGGTVLYSYTPSGHSYRVSVNALPPNATLYARVQAVAINDATTLFSSSFLFYTPPRRPAAIVVSNRTETSARISWKNRLANTRLRHYRVMVWEGKKRILAKNSNNQLSRAYTTLTIRHLQPGKRYTVQVRAVSLSHKKSLFRVMHFRTPVSTAIEK